MATPAPLRCRIQYDVGYYSLNVALWTRSSFSRVSDGNSQAVALVNRFVQLLGYGARITRVVMSWSDINRQSSVVGSNLYVSTPSRPATPLNAGTTDFADTACLLRLEDNDGHRKLMFIGGIPDAIVERDPASGNVVIVPDAQWLTAITAFRAELQARWSWRAKLAPRDGGFTTTISGLVQAAIPPGNVGLRSFNPGVTTFPGAKVQVTGASTVRGPGTKQLNGMWIVERVDPPVSPDDQFTTYLQASSLVPISQITRYGELRSVSYGTWPVVDLAIEGVAGRKRGVRSGRPVGRVKTRR